MNNELQSLKGQVCFGDCVLNVEARELLFKGQKQRLRRLVFDLMLHLIQQRPAVVSHQALALAVWHRRDVKQAMVARAVMEARLACGDSAANPRLFVSVHGVGYRFVGTVGVEAPAQGTPAAPGQTDLPVEPLRQLIDDARQAAYEKRFAQGLALAKQALALAQALGVQTQRIRALLVCAHAAANSGAMSDAARFASQALQIARAEGVAQFIGESHLAVGGVHVLAGDLETGIHHLRAAAEVLSQPGLEAQLIRCLNWLSRALRDQGQLQAALDLCRRGVALTGQCKGPTFTLSDRLNEVQLLLELGDADVDAGQAERAQQAYEQGVQAGQRLAAELTNPEHGTLLAECLHHLSALFERLGRLGEAEAAAAACDAEVARLPQGTEWLDPDNRYGVLVQRARLKARLGLVDAALVSLRQTLQEAAEQGASEHLARLLRHAADIATLAGEHVQAAQWFKMAARKLLEAQQSRATSMAAILAAELGRDAMQAQLDDMAEDRRALLVENAELRRRLQRLEGMALPPLASGGTRADA